MVRILRLLLAFVALVIIVTFAIANRTPVEVSFAPLPAATELPVYGVFLLGLVLGALIGGFGMWLGRLGLRREARRLRNRLWAVENQISLLKQQEEKAHAESYSAQRALSRQAAE